MEGADFESYGSGGGGGDRFGGPPPSYEQRERRPPPTPAPPPRQLAEGELVTGVVSGIAAFGVFLDVGGGRSGLVHCTELANAGPEVGKKDPAGQAATAAILENYTRGDPMAVVVLKIADDGRINLSEKLAIAQAAGGGMSGDGSAWAVSSGDDDFDDGGPGTPRASEEPRLRRR